MPEIFLQGHILSTGGDALIRGHVTYRFFFSSMVWVDFEKQNAYNDKD
jgi:hypothetical protein